MNPRQAYAPTPYSYVPNTTSSATINLDEEVQLTSTRSERDLHDALAELFSIIVTLDELEKAFIKDAIPEAEYAEICERSLRQYKALLADETIANEFQSLDDFKAKFDLDVPRATERIRVGMPSTIVDASSSVHVAPPPTASAAPNSVNTGVLVLDATEAFVTFFDALSLGFLSTDQLHPLLSDIIQAVNRLSDQDFDSRGKIVQWLITLNQMKASQELDEQRARDLQMDMRRAYQGFKSTLA